MPAKRCWPTRQPELQDRAGTRDGRGLARASRQSAREIRSRTISSKRRWAMLARRPSTTRATACPCRRSPSSNARFAIGSKPLVPNQRFRSCANALAPRRPNRSLNPASRDPLNLSFPNTSLRDILNFIGNPTSINITYDRDVQDRLVTINLSGVTLEQALNQIMTMNQLSLQILSERSIFVFPDTGPEARDLRRAGRSHLLRVCTPTRPSWCRRWAPSCVCQAWRFSRRSSPTRPGTRSPSAPTASVVQIIEEDHSAERQAARRDRHRRRNPGGRSERGRKPTASTSRILAGDDLLAGGVAEQCNRDHQPDAWDDGGGATVGGTQTTAGTGSSTPPSGVRSPPPFNLNTISRGVSTSDFYLAVPTAIVNFLEAIRTRGSSRSRRFGARRARSSP